MEPTKKHSFAPMWRLIKRRKYYFLGAFVATALNVLIGFITPAILAELIDHYLGDKPSRLPDFVNSLIDMLGGRAFAIENLWIFGAALIAINLIKGAFSYLKGRWCAVASEDTAESLRNRLYNHVQHLPYNYHVNAQTGDLLQRGTSDVETIRRFLNVQLMSVFNSVMMIGIALSLMLPVSGTITMLSMLPLPLMLIFSWRFFGTVIKAYRNTETAEGKMSTVLQENLTGMRVVRAFGQQQSEVENFNDANQKHHQTGIRMALLDATYWTSGDLFSAAQMLIIEIACILEAVAGGITVGDMVILITYSGMLMGPTRQLGRILSDAGKSMVALERIDEVLHEPAESLDEEGIEAPLDGDIEFDHVSFSYDENQEVLRDVNFTIKSGQTVALLGATGSGKSTLIHLLQRLYEPTGGAIRIGGMPVSRIPRKHLRQRIGLVLQEPFLYSKTIKDNVAIAVREPRQAAIDVAVRDASAWEFITTSEKGYETLVGERGVTLSGGQKQRIAIARILMKANDILVFDDSLSAVDTQTDAHIRQALKRRSKGVTTIIISHRVTTLSQADKIYVLEKGRITQCGTHDELLAQGGLYARINAIQNGQEVSA